MPIKVAVQRALRAGPARDQIVRWVRRALSGRRRDAVLTVRIVDTPEGAALNARWRGKPGATNVLSFPADGLAAIAPEQLGDIVICAPVVAREATAQGKHADAHWAHLVVHGVLHLIGFDHVRAREARVMEAHEREILAALGFPDPYEEVPYQ